MNHGDESVIRVTASSEQAHQLLNDLAENEDVRNRLSSRDSAAEALREYGIEISDDLIPPDPQLPPPEEVREALESIISGAEGPPPYAAFRPPWCDPTVEGPPPYGIIYSILFSLVEHRARQPEE